MKVLHLTGWPIPETMAGTEVYVTSLSRALQCRGVETVIGCLDPARAGTVAAYRDVHIHRFAPASTPDGGSQSTFVRWLEGIDPDIVHLQALTQGLGRAEVDAIVEAGYPVVHTAHLPGVTCRRGTMMRNGSTPCDGEMLVERCAVCLLQQRGLPVWAGRLLTAMPQKMRYGLAAVAPRKVATALTLMESARDSFANTHVILAQCQRVIAVCQWLYDCLVRNGVPESKLVLSRQATEIPEGLPPKRQRMLGRLLRVGYIGRYDPLKGVEVLVQAAAGLACEVPVQVRLHGTADGFGGAAYLAKLHALARGDPRISIGGPLPREQMAEFFADIDVLAVPSTWLETGPLVVYEALAHRTPVLGSRLGGIVELIRDGQDGWLVSAGDVMAWRRQLEALVEPGFHLPVVDSKPPALRSWDQAADEMSSLYSQVLHRPVGDAVQDVVR